MAEANGANRMRIRNTTIPWMIPENGDTAPFLILVAVLAMAPVAGMPPNSGVTMLAIP
ncbi:hypothetical protein D3C71_2237430 [compost metagenome]